MSASSFEQSERRRFLCRTSWAGRSDARIGRAARIAFVSALALLVSLGAPAAARDAVAPAKAERPSISPKALAAAKAAEPEAESQDEVETATAGAQSASAAAVVLGGAMVEREATVRTETKGETTSGGLIDFASMASLGLLGGSAVKDPAEEVAAVSRALIDKGAAEGDLPLSPRSGEAGYVLVDLKTRKVLEQRKADDAFIPASVAKVPTALYALDALGPDYRFETGVYADGEILDGVLQGDLYLVGSGDPTLDTGDLAELAKALKAQGLKRVAGAFYFDPSALPTAPQLEPTQPVHAAYNPSISGLNLNFNRVMMKWRREKKGEYTLEMLSHSARYSTPAATHMIGLLSKDDDGPIYQYERAERRDAPGEAVHEYESWRVKKRILGRGGRRWFPVQRPGVYAAKSFQSVAAEMEVNLPDPKVSVLPGGPKLVAAHQSEPLKEILRGMLRFSTNLTAEAVGMTASRARGLKQMSFEQSGALMTGWVGARFGLDTGETATAVNFKNHSGLDTGSRVSPRALVEILANAAPDDAGLDAFRQLMPNHRDRAIHKNATVRAKTGTVFFGRGLAGYITCKNGGEYAFAYFQSDIPTRKKVDANADPESTAKPAGGSSWLARARQIERKLLTRWTTDRCG